MRRAPLPVVLGLDLGGTKLAAALFSANGKILHRASTQLRSRRGNQVGVLICAQLRKLRRVANQRGWRVEAVGICVPGIAHPKTGRVWAPNIPGWEGYPLREEISAALGRETIPVVVDSDRAAYILGEAWQGAARGCRDAVFLAVGTGIGAGILVNGEVLRGAHDIAGAVGWLALDRPFRREYIPCGGFEHYASGAGLAKLAQRVVAGAPAYRGPQRRKRNLTTADVFSAADAGDVIAVHVLHNAVELWGMASANLVSLFNPEKIIFGGGVFGPATRFLNDIRAEAKKWAQPISMRRAKFEASQLGGDAGLYGAGFLALRSLESMLQRAAGQAEA